MPLPSQEAVNEMNEMLRSSDEEEEEEEIDPAAEVARQSIRRATAAGVVPPPPPDDAIVRASFFPFGQQTQSQTQDTLIPTQHSEVARNHMILSQLSMTQGSAARGTEFDALERHLREQFPTQSQVSNVTQNNTQNATQGKSMKKNIKGTKGRSSGARGYTEEERLNFLEIIERRMPTSGTEWSLVASEHATTYPDNERDVTSIKRQYQALLRRREPTGDPNCPPDVKKAKAIDRLLKAKQRAGDISMENGGPMAALAGMEIREEGTDDIDASVATNLTSPNIAGSALVQKKSSPKTQSSSSLIESLISFQMIQSQKNEERREEERLRDEKRRVEAKEQDDKRRELEERRLEEKRQREDRERKEQRRRDERREAMFLSVMTAGIAAFSGNRVDPSTLMDSLQQQGSSDSEDERPPTKRMRQDGKQKDDRDYNE